MLLEVEEEEGVAVFHLMGMGVEQVCLVVVKGEGCSVLGEDKFVFRSF